MNRWSRRTAIVLTLCVSAGVSYASQGQTSDEAPLPPIVTPGSAPTEPTPPPSDAVVLFDGKSLDQWVATRDGGSAGWTVADGVVTVQKAAGAIQTRRSFRNYQLHLEWRVPANVTGSGQSRGNSGVFLAALGPDVGYEIQVLDSYGNTTYANGQAGAVYKQYPPLVNASRKPGEWQSYDIIWTAPVFGADRALVSPARVTVVHNGVLVQNNAVLQGQTQFIGKPRYEAHGAAPILLQAHRDPSEPVSFRNIWLRELP